MTWQAAWWARRPTTAVVLMRAGRLRGVAMVRVIGLILLAVLLVVPSAVNATHSVPSPLYFWDGNDNGVPSGEPDFDQQGPYWSSDHHARLMDALEEWSGRTDYDPGYVADGPHNIFVDGRLPNPDNHPNCLGSWGPILAVTCRIVEPRIFTTGFLYYRIVDQDIFFNMERAGAPNWWVGSGKPPDADRFHFGGVLTHELGHTVRLIHVPNDETNCPYTSSGMITMCPSVSDNNDSYWIRTLHSDDIASANSVY